MLKCPVCKTKGEVRGTEESYEARGQWPDGGWPVRKCNACGAGLIVKVRLVPPGARAVVISEDTWERMQEMWDEAFPEADPVEDDEDDDRPWDPEVLPTLASPIAMSYFEAVVPLYVAAR